MPYMLYNLLVWRKTIYVYMYKRKNYLLPIFSTTIKYVILLIWIFLYNFFLLLNLSNIVTLFLAIHALKHSVVVMFSILRCHTLQFLMFYLFWVSIVCANYRIEETTDLRTRIVFADPSFTCTIRLFHATL